MVQSVNTSIAQTISSPLQQRGEQQQQQISQRQQSDDASVTARNPQSTETRVSGTEAAQSQGTNNTQTGSRGAPTQLSVSDARAEFGENPPRGSLVNISA